MQTGGQHRAPVALRLLAFAIDVALTALAVLALRPLLGQAAAAAGVVNVVALGFCAWVVLHNLVFSPGKWLLALRLEDPDGSFASSLLWNWRVLSRWRREPWRWRVCSYTPSRAGVALRLAVTAAALGFALWAGSMLRPSIGGSEAERLASGLVLNDAQLRHSLGEPVRLDIRAVARRGQQGEAGTASFALRLRGQHARQDMRVHARRVQGAWSIEELSDIEIAPAGDAAEVAER